MKPTTEYFNVEENLAAYAQHYGRPLSDNAVGIIQEFATFINQAYVDGYNAALEDMARK